MTSTIDIKNGTTKTLTIKKDSVINFTDLSTDSNYGILSNFSFKRSGKNLIIQNDTAKISLTIKNYFTTKNHGAYTKSKLQGLLFNGANQLEMGAGKIQQIAEYAKFEFDSKTNSAYGTMFWDNGSKTIDLSGSTYNSLSKLNAYTGAGNDTVKFGKSTVTTTRTVYAGSDTTTTIDLSYLGKGTKISSFSAKKDGSLVFNGNNNETYVVSKYLKNGQNTKIKAYSGNDLKDITLAEYINSNLTNNTNGVNYFGNSTSKKKLKVVGNFLNNTLVGGKKADKIYCVGGANTVIGGYGNDKLYAGTGADTFKFTYADANLKGWGKDTIYNAGSTDKIQFTDLSATDSALDYIKKGNNLVINAYAWNSKKGKSVISDSITVKDYFKADKGKSINDKDRLGKVNDTLINDIAVKVEGGKYNTLGKGKYYIYLNKKNTTAVLDKSADATIILGSSSSFNRKTLVETYKYQNVNGDVTTKKGNDLVVQYYNVKEKYSYKTYKLKRSIKENYITLKDYFSTDLSNAGRGKSTININNAKIYYGDEQNVKQLLQNCEYIQLTSTNNLDTTDLAKGVKNYRIDSIDKSLVDVSYWVTGSKKNDRITITNSHYNYIDSRGGNDVIHADGGTSGSLIMYSSGFDNCITGTYNDTYCVGAILKSITKFKQTGFNKNSKLLVNDKGGSDKMHIAAKSKDLRIMFNVNKDGKITTNQTEALLRSDNKYTDSLLIFNKSALTGKNIQKMIKNNGFNGAIEIDNWFGVGSDTSSAVNCDKTDGQGRIDKIYDNNDKEINMTNWITQVKNDVVSWLTSGTYGGKFNSVADVLNSNDTKAINSLVAIYSKDVYTA